MSDFVVSIHGEANSRENTPSHCRDCWKFETCNQAQYMTAETEAVAGFTVPAIVDHLCENCLQSGVDSGELTPEEEDAAFPLNWEELDSPAHCSVCGVPLIHALTSEGVRYVREAVQSGDGCTRELWREIWKDYLETETEEG